MPIITTTITITMITMMTISIIGSLIMTEGEKHYTYVSVEAGICMDSRMSAVVVMKA